MEKEVILLRSVYDHIGEMVNFSLMDVNGKDPSSMIMFKGLSQRKLFFIILVDFLSVTDRRGPIPQVSFLKGLADICDNPSFSVDNSEEELKTVVQNFTIWLKEEKNIDIQMPGINEQVNLTLSRVDAIKMSGDVSKHNYLRAVGVAERLQEKLKQSGIEVSLDESIIALPDFYSRFHDDILIYLSSYICEFLNNIRWAIHTYLRPEFNKSFYYADDECLEYKFRTPDQIKSKYAINCYWELMNNMRRLPCMRKFIVSDSLKTEY